MRCTNCGAQVDDKSIFCPVCGNKLEKSSDIHKENDDVIEKSTYESIKNNENLIEEKSNNKKNKDSKKSKDSKVSNFISNLVKKNNKDSKEDKNIKEDKNLVDNADKDLEDKNSDLDNKVTSSKDLSKSSPIINQNKVESDKISYNSDISKEKINKNIESNLSAQARIANKIGKEKGFNNNAQSLSNIKYDDIPKEYVEARIARQILSKNRIKDLSYNNEKAIKSGNICGVIRNNQKPDFYTGYDSSYHVSTKNFNEEAPPPKEESFEVNPKFKTTSLAVVEEAKKQNHKFKFKPIYLIPILIVLAGLIAAYFFTHKKAPEIEVDLSDYIDVAYNGDDGAASPSASLNTSKLLSDYGNQIAYKNKDRKKDEFSSAANQFVSELENGITFQYSKDKGLSNGEEITVVANITDSSIMEDYNVLFTNTMKSAIVDDLITSESQDPFDYIDVSFSGESPNINLTAKLKDDAPEYMQSVEIAPSKTTDLSSGEEVNVSLIYDEDELYKSYGIKLDPKDKAFKAPGESDDETDENEDDDEDKKKDKDSVDGYITSVDNIDQDLLNTLKEKAGNLIKDTFEDRSFTQIDKINYLGAITGSDVSAEDLKNRVMLIYEIKAKEDYEGKYNNDYTYYSFVEYQNVKNEKGEDGNFYTEGPITTDNEIFHKFFVEDDYTYYEIPYYGFAFLEEVTSRVNNALSGLDIDDSIEANASKYFEKSDGVAGEYQGDNTRLSLKSDGTLKYKVDQRVHQGTWKEDGSDVSLTIQGVNVDTPIDAKFKDGTLDVSEQGEMQGQIFNKMKSM
jgi:hypothetical protein